MASYDEPYEVFRENYRPASRETAIGAVCFEERTDDDGSTYFTVSLPHQCGYWKIGEAGTTEEVLESIAVLMADLVQISRAIRRKHEVKG